MEKYFVIEQKALLAILSSMQPICTKRTTIDATSTILFHIGYREAILKSTDLEISLQSSCPLIESNLNEPETFLVPGKRIFDIVKELDGPISCIISNNQLHLKAGSVNLSLNIKNAQDFPPFPERIENLMQFGVTNLRTMLESVAFLIPQNNANPALNGLLLEISAEQFTLTATDGHCLAQARSTEYRLAEPHSWLLPRRAVFELKKILESTQDAEIFLGVCGKHLVFSGELFNFFTRLIGDPFPQYQAILDKVTFIPAQIDRAHLIKTLRRSACLLSGQFLATKFEFTAEQLRVSLHNKEVGNLDEYLPMQGFEDTLSLRFYAPYLLNGLQVFEQEKITFFLKNGTRPIIFEAENQGMHLTYLVMPVSPTN
ncbi:MAG: DNA polymerase III subunit beta [Candidatus Babeliaceae bacterium]